MKSLRIFALGVAAALVAAGAATVASATDEIQLESCSSYCDSCGYKGAKYGTCDACESCKDRNKTAEEDRRNREKGPPNGKGEAPVPPKAVTGRGAAPAR